LQNIYNRIAQLGKTIQALQDSLDKLNSALSEKVTKLVESIKAMSKSVDREGEAQNLVFQQLKNDAIAEIKRLQENVGTKDLDELLNKLRTLTKASEETLRPETVDVLLHEVLQGLNKLKEIKVEKKEE
jgi:proline dehydrogenase